MFSTSSNIVLSRFSWAPPFWIDWFSMRFLYPMGGPASGHEIRHPKNRQFNEIVNHYWFSLIMNHFRLSSYQGDATLLNSSHAWSVKKTFMYLHQDYAWTSSKPIVVPRASIRSISGLPQSNYRQEKKTPIHGLSSSSAQSHKFWLCISVW